MNDAQGNRGRESVHNPAMISPNFLEIGDRAFCT